VARALVVDIQHGRQLGWPAVQMTARRSLDYLHAAFDPLTGTFRNFRADDGTWLDIPASQDCQGRALLALATVAAPEPPGTPSPAEVARAADLFGHALPAATGLTAIRAVASIVIACGLMARPSALRSDAAPILSALDGLAGRLGRAFRAARRHGSSDARNTPSDWLWPEPAVTYEAFLLPRALIVAGYCLGRDDLLLQGRGVFDWLLDRLVDRAGQFHPIGNHGWWQRGDQPARFDQQPIEAGSLAAAADAAHLVTGDPTYAAAAEAAYGWFTGCNDLGVPVAIPASGGCQDGLEADRLNSNQGAESTLAWLATVEHIREIRARGQAGQRSGSRWPWGSGRGQDSTYSSTAP
jgi:hypothetical protein